MNRKWVGLSSLKTYFLHQDVFKGPTAFSNGVSSLVASIETCDPVGEVLHSNYKVVEGSFRSVGRGVVMRGNGGKCK